MPDAVLPPQSLDDPALPKHAQLRRILEELCTTTLRPGDFLPGERALERTYGCSRITIRRAIGDLVAAGRLRRVPGKGTVVAPNPLISRLHLASFSSEMRAQDVAASSKILLSERTPAPPEVAAWFGTPPSVAHIRLRRLRLGDGEPYAIDDGWYNAELAPDLLENDVYNSVYAILGERYALPVTDAVQNIAAVAASEEAAALLDVAPGAPLLHISRQSQSHGRRVEYCSSLYRTDRYQVQTQVTRARDR